ncbi:MAG TPA: glycosyltransferase family 2 protein [Candidatus Gracilibacteria bacterium]
MKHPKLSIVVPCYNEAQNIPIILNRFEKCLLNNDFELILVNDGSKDGSSAVFTAEMAARKHPQIRVVDYEKNKGYGGAIMTGLREAKGEYLSWTHADSQTDPMDIERGFEIFQYSKNPKKLFVKGTRVGRKLGDVLFTFGMSAIATVVLLKPLFDVNAQPKMFHRSFFERVEKKAPSDFSLDLYFLYLAKKFGLKVKSFPVLFLDRRFGESAWAFSFSSKFKTICRTIKYIFALRTAVRTIK